ncbi:tetratricopeptide repeat protein [Candidatus Acetothermia bacterium]|nr:tetratricopeptide repeat protein [Candidatus Acetothermia bacterium]
MSNPIPVRGESERRQEVSEALQRAEELRREKRYDQGIDLLVDALQYGVDKAQIYYRLGNLYFDAKKVDHAEYAYRKTIEIEPNHVNAHHNLSVVFRQQGKISESVKFRKKASSLARRHPEQLQMSPEQVQHARGYARKWIIVGGVAIGIILIALILFSLRQ